MTDKNQMVHVIIDGVETGIVMSNDEYEKAVSAFCKQLARDIDDQCINGSSHD